MYGEIVKNGQGYTRWSRDAEMSKEDDDNYWKCHNEKTQDAKPLNKQRYRQCKVYIACK